MEVADLRRFRSYRNWILAHGRTELYHEPEYNELLQKVLGLPCSRGGYHGLWVDMKAVDERVSAEQARWLRELQAALYLCRVRYGADEAIKELERYMQMREEARHGDDDGGRDDEV